MNGEIFLGHGLWDIWMGLKENSACGKPSSFSLVGWDKLVHFWGGLANEHQTEVSNVLFHFSYMMVPSLIELICLQWTCKQIQSDVSPFHSTSLICTNIFSFLNNYNIKFLPKLWVFSLHKISLIKPITKATYFSMYLKTP